MITRDEAVVLAGEFLRREIQPHVREEVMLTQKREFASNWVVGYNSRAFVETRSIRHALAGGGPMIISKADGSIRVGGTALPIEEQVEGPEVAASALDLGDRSSDGARGG